MSGSNSVVAGSPASAAAAQQFVEDLMTNDDLYKQYSSITNLPNGATPDPTTVTAWLQQKGYNTTFSDLATALKTAHGNNLNFFSGIYNTQYEDGTAGPTITISNGNVTVDQTAIGFPAFSNGILSWTEQSETTNASFNMFNLVGLHNLKQANGGPKIGLVKNAYLGAQFRGTFWQKGAQQPTSPNCTGRQGKLPKWKPSAPPATTTPGTSSLPSTATVSPTKGPLQAATIHQWADTYRIYTIDATAKQPTPTTNTLVIGQDGSVTYANVAIKVPRFSNDKLQWFVTDGNSLNVDINLTEKNVSTPNSSWTGNQFYARNWGTGQQAPTTYNWFGAVNAGYNPGPVKQQADGMTALAQVANRALDLYLMQMQIKFYFDMAKLAFEKVIAPLFKKIVEKVKAWRKGPEVQNPEEDPIEPDEPVEEPPVEEPPVDDLPGEGPSNVEEPPAPEPPAPEPPIPEPPIPEPPVPAPEPPIPEPEPPFPEPDLPIDPFEGGGILDDIAPLAEDIPLFAI
ncbi:hypothetical protein ABW21_db0202771 [Orbilia brochopaga]|nr:hypothetical protein ABW21_db0202771 [Drechslerella brochopaga]